jgi:uncharacterized membrane protein YcjF (UPF0283 family)
VLYIPLLGAVVVLSLLVWFETKRHLQTKLAGAATRETHARFGRRLLCAGLLLVSIAAAAVAVQWREELSPAAFFAACGASVVLLLVLVCVLIADVRTVLRQSLAEFADDKAEERRFREFVARQERTDLSPPTRKNF